MNNIILNSLEFFFKQRATHKYQELTLTDEIYQVMPIAILDKKKIKYNLIGTVKSAGKGIDEFTWAWNLNIPKHNYIKSKQLLLYAVNMDINTLQDTYIKTLLTTATHIVNADNLIIIVALSLYLTKADSMFTERHSDGHVNFFGSYNIDEAEHHI